MDEADKLGDTFLSCLCGSERITLPKDESF